MPRTYVKTAKHNPFPNPVTEREEILSVLWGLGVLVAGYWLIDTSQLRDIMQAQVYKIQREPEFQQGHMTDEAKAAYREFNDWRNRRNQ